MSTALVADKTSLVTAVGQTLSQGDLADRGTCCQKINGDNSKVAIERLRTFRYRLILFFGFNHQLLFRTISFLTKDAGKDLSTSKRNVPAD